MALSKRVPDVPIITLRTSDGESSQLLSCIWNAGGRFAVRMVAPFRELGEDMAGGITFYVKNAIELAWAFAPTKSALAILKELEKRPLKKALKELSDDTNGLWIPALLTAMFPIAPAGPLILASVKAPIQLTYLGCSAIAVIGVHKFYNQKHGLPTVSQREYDRAAFTSLVTGGVYVFLAAGGLAIIGPGSHIPPEWIKHIINPDLFTYAVANLMLYPAVIQSVGYVGGAKPTQLVPSMLVNMAGSAALGLSCTDLLGPADTWGPCGAAASSMVLYMLSSTQMTGLAHTAAQLSYANKVRVEYCVDASGLFWASIPFFQMLNLAELFSPGQAQVIFAMLQTPGIMGILHILLKSRPAMEAAAHHFEDP